MIINTTTVTPPPTSSSSDVLNPAVLPMPNVTVTVTTA